MKSMALGRVFLWVVIALLVLSAISFVVVQSAGGRT